MLKRDSSQKRLLAAAPASLLAASALASPVDVRGLVLRLDADAAHVTRDSDGLVSSWSDVIETGSNLSSDHVGQTDSARRPLWVEKAVGGRPALKFDGGDLLVNTESNLVVAGSARTVFVVGRLDDRTNGATLFTFRRSTTAQKPLFGVNLYVHGSNGPFLVYTDGSHGHRNTPILERAIALEAIRRPFVSAHHCAGSGQAVGVDLNGIPLSISSAATVSAEDGLTGFAVGGTATLPDNGWHGLISEVLVYNRALDPAERNAVGSYLARKYGIQGYGVAILPRLHVAVPEVRRPNALAEAVTLENDLIAAKFDSRTGSLIELTNKLAKQTLDVWGDEFRIEASELTLEQRDADLVSLGKESEEQLQATYQADGCKVVATWRLGREQHFLEKRLVVTSSSAFGLRDLVISRPGFSGAPLELVRYRHMKSTTYFGRSLGGGIFLGVELAFDHSSLDARNRVTLGYAPNLKIKEREQIVCEPIYLGVYGRHEGEQEQEALPLASESEAMVAMTAAILPPTHRRLGPLMCGWWSETFRRPYRTAAHAEHDMRSIDFCKECGIDIISDGRTWSGATLEVNALKGDEELRLSELALKVAHYARQQGVRWCFWPTMGNSDPWSGRGRQLRPDRPDWTMIHEGADRANSKPAACFGHKPFYGWSVKINVEAMDAGRYGAWCMDGDFAGGAGWGGGPSGSVHPARCHSKLHDHVTPDIDYCCQRNLTELAGLMRRRYPDVYMLYCRPPMDLGVWALRHVNASFTVNEWAEAKGLPGLGSQPVNVMMGDKIRYWSRIRVHHHFFPHYLDSPQVFVAPRSMGNYAKHDWPSDHIDYIMLSALSSSPNQTYYLPSQAGLPADDKRQIKRWLDWGRKNIDFLMVRKDLPDWPAVGKVDGSAHICGDRGLVFLFNPNKNPQEGTFALTEKSIGLKQAGAFELAQEHPEPDRRISARHGDMVCWEVAGESTVILRVRPSDG